MDLKAHRKVWMIAGPAILANSSTPIVGLVDTWAIGHLPGAAHLAAIGLGSVVFTYIFWAFGFLRMGTTGLVAQAKGRNDDLDQSTITIRSFALAILFGFILIACQHLIIGITLDLMAPPADVAQITSTYFSIRIWAAPWTLINFAIAGVLFGLAKVKEVLWLQLLLNITNGILNIVFVIVFEMGVAGVALGTLLAQMITVIASLWLLMHHFGRRLLFEALRSAATWSVAGFKKLLVINGFIFLRTIALLTALTLIMRLAADLGTVEMAVSHVLNQYMLLMALGLDAFAHASEALAGAAWGRGDKSLFRRWVYVTALWSLIASLIYALFFWLFGNELTALLTNVEPVGEMTATLMPIVIAMPVVSVWCYLFDGVYIAATAALAMLVTMSIAFVVYCLILWPMTAQWGMHGLWTAVLVFMAIRGLTQAIWYPHLERQIQ